MKLVRITTVKCNFTLWRHYTWFSGPNQISVANTAVLADGNTTAIYGTAYQPDPENQPGYLIVSFPGRKYSGQSLSLAYHDQQDVNNKLALGPDGSYYVLDTDYTTWTAVYDCVMIGAFKFEYAWLMGRTNSLTPEQLAAAQEACKDRFHIEKFVFKKRLTPIADLFLF